MPIKPKPFVYVCPSCGWHKAVAPKSDVLMPGEYYECCPVCGNASLERKNMDKLTEIKLKVFGRFLF